MTETPILTGQDIAEAYGAVETLLEHALGETDTTNREYVVLRVLAARGPVEAPTSLHEYLAGQRQLDLSPTAVEELLAGLEARALATGTAKDAPGPAKLTAHGTELLRGLTETVAPRTRVLFAGIAGEDLATAHRVLREIIDRTPSIASLRSE
jgi:DNA-binding MarR family transcriptional regulator